MPLSRTMKEKIAALRNWCKTRARPASSEYAAEQQQESGRALDLDHAGASK